MPHTPTPTPHVDPLHPELWLLLTDPATEPEAPSWASKALQQLATRDALAAWRMQHHRVRLIATHELQAALQAGLAEGCPAVHVHASGPADALFDAVDAFHLPSASERLVNLHGWGRPIAAWWPALEAELTRPDAWVEVGWRLSRGLNIPPLAMPGDEESRRTHQAAFKAWRAERFKLGDSGLLPGDDDDDEPMQPAAEAPPLAAEGDLQADADADLDADADAEADPIPWSTGQRPPPTQGITGARRLGIGARRVALYPQRDPQGITGARRLGIGAMGALHASSASPTRQLPWFPVAVFTGEVLAPGASTRWPYTLHIERQSAHDGPEAPWLYVQARVEWAADVAAQARRHAHRLCLLPRLQAPVVLKLLAGRDRDYFSFAEGAIERMKQWPEALPGTPVTLIPLP